MTDERFERRHEVHEKAEKRRKKWNSHNTRFELEMARRRHEEERKEAIRQGLALEDDEDAPPRLPFSFWPQPRPERGAAARDELGELKLEVVDSLPALAFGVPVAAVAGRRSFALPTTGPNAVVGLAAIPPPSPSGRRATAGGGRGSRRFTLA